MHGTRPMPICHWFVTFRRDNTNWFPRGLDLISIDFFLWNFLKSKAYVNKPTSLPQGEIRHEMETIREPTCQSVIRKFGVTQNQCREGKPLGDIILKK